MNKSAYSNDIDYVKELLRIRFIDKLYNIGIKVKEAEPNSFVAENCTYCQGRYTLHISEKNNNFHCVKCESSGNIKTLFNQSTVKILDIGWAANCSHQSLGRLSQ
jgi:hypothetical protein